MSLDIVEALKGGFSDTVTRNGLIFVGVSYLLTVVSTASAQSAMYGWMSGMSGTANVGQALPLALGGPIALWAVVGLLAWLGTVVLTIGVLRSFLNRSTDQINGTHFKRNLGLALVNFIVGSIVFALAVGIGFILLVIPGIFLLVSLIFWQVYVVEEDQNFIEAFQSSWELTSGNRFKLFALGIGALVVGFAISVIFGLPSALLGFLSPGIGALVSNIGNAFVTVFTLATLANAYRQLQ